MQKKINKNSSFKKWKKKLQLLQKAKNSLNPKNQNQIFKKKNLNPIPILKQVWNQTPRLRLHAMP
jgi:hypothetical protein